MVHIWDDLRFAARRLRDQPGFALVAVLTLALGLGANIAIFTLVHALMLRSLPVDRPDELYRLGDTNNCCVNSGLQGSYSLFSYRLYEHLRDSTRDEFSTMAGFQATTLALGVRRSGATVGESLPGQFVTDSYFSMFGVRAAAGRVLAPGDDRVGAEPVAIMSHQAWTRYYGQDHSVVGSVFIINGTPFTIVGIAAEGFFGDTVRPNPPSVWIPIGQEPRLRSNASIIDSPGQDWLYAIGRLRPESSAERASTRATAALQQWLSQQAFLSEQNRQALTGQHITVTSAGSGVGLLRAQFGRPLTVLFVTSGLLLLVAAANLANLLLARADRGQAAIRAALGASSGRLVLQSLTEGVVIALAGGVVGLAVASLSIRALIALAFPGAAFVPVDATPSPAVMLFGLGLAVLTGAVFTAGPAWAMSRTSPLEALAGVGRSGHQRSFVPRRSLVIAQVVVSLVLLSGSGLLGTSLGNLERQPLGFDPGDRFIVRVQPPAIAQQQTLIRLYERIRERLAQVPGIVDASYALYSPMEGDNWSSGISIAGMPVDPSRQLSSSWNRVGPRYFETLETRLLKGRLPTERDLSGGPRVAVVNDAFRRRFFETTDPIGQRLGIGDASHSGDYEVVGVVDDVKYTAATEPTRPMMFLPAFQAVEYDNPTDRSVQARSMLLRAIVVRVASGTANVEPAVRQAIAEIDGNISVLRVLPLADQVSANFRIQRLMARLTSFYGLLALGLASLGLYGVTAYSAAQRTREMGIRMALGANRQRIVRTILIGPVTQTLLGLAIGLPLSMLASRAMASQLYGVTGTARVFGAATVVLVASALVAALLPALRAMSMNPTRALRQG